MESKIDSKLKLGLTKFYEILWYHILIIKYDFLDLDFDSQSEQFWDHNYHAVGAYGNVINNVIPLQPFIQNDDLGCIEYEPNINIHHDYEADQFLYGIEDDLEIKNAQDVASYKSKLDFLNFISRFCYTYFLFFYVDQKVTRDAETQTDLASSIYVPIFIPIFIPEVVPLIAEIEHRQYNHQDDLELNVEVVSDSTLSTNSSINSSEFTSWDEDELLQIEEDILADLV